MRPTRRVLALCSLLLLSPSASGSWVVQPAAALVDGADLVVVGTLTEGCFRLHDGKAVTTGTIRVEATLSGPDGTGASVAVRWSEGVGVVCPRFDHQQHLGLRSLWLLRRVGDGYETSTDASVVPLTGGGAHASLVLQLRKAPSPSPLVRRVLAFADEELVRLQPGLAASR